MREPNRLVWLALALLGVGVLAGLVVVVSGFVLADLYRPPAPGADPTALPGSVRTSLAWTDRHEWWAVVALVASLVGVGLVAWLQVERMVSIRGALVTLAGLLAVLAPIATMLTRPRVQWQQIGLWAVTVGVDLDGYWVAAFDDRVRFVLVDGSEVTKGEYAVMLVAHLTVPLLGVAALLALLVELLRDARPARPMRRIASEREAVRR